MELLGHIQLLHLTFWETFLKQLHLHSNHQCYKCSDFSTSSPILVFFITAIQVGLKWLCHCGFYLCFPNDINCLHMPIEKRLTSLEKHLLKNCPFLKARLLSHVNCLIRYDLQKSSSLCVIFFLFLFCVYNFLISFISFKTKGLLVWETVCAWLAYSWPTFGPSKTWSPEQP